MFGSSTSKHGGVDNARCTNRVGGGYYEGVISRRLEVIDKYEPSEEELKRAEEMAADVKKEIDMLKDVSDETIEHWISSENISLKNKRTFQGFEITDSIDGGARVDREVSLVKITGVSKYPQHIHAGSDAFFIIVSGSAIFLNREERKEIRKGDKIKIPRGMPHGFELKEGEALEFISIQSPPIRNSETGEEDFHLTDFV